MMSQTGPFGLIGSLGTVSKVVLLVLLLFSVVSWTIILVKWRTFHAGDGDDRRFLNAFARSKDQEELRRQARRLPASPTAMLFVGVTDRLQETPRDGSGVGSAESAEASTLADRQYLDRVVAHLVQDQIARQEAYLPFLATTGNITPFVGLLGTVMGIIDAFGEIGKQGTASIAAVAPGVAEALVATAAGLFTAIPAVIAYNYFLNRIRKSAFRAEAFSIELVHQLQARSKTTGVRG
ncbi:MAG: MotA/TolQ/ExbB proton channel family protein [Nitrospirota bacterium]|nr:MotA/TolQ/ExbB proton channel family protein [Nitrospirota bacterium]MDE3224239.1 MotA/TolQ/ExbB proton channel family protein [Nitrospirota bacterium]MDE3242094.1 MotA/TolQ/ExbB proton channel family protein [Nitrospirota bacterium]